MGEATGLAQLFKLPALHQHFLEHKQRNSTVSFLSFLAMHYWGDDFDESDNDRDRDLPFKNNDISVPAFLYAITHKVIDIKPQHWPTVQDFGIERPAFHFNPAGQSLFRPPRV